MAKINWYDELLIEGGEKKGIELICRGDEWAPAGDENLVYKAGQLLYQRCGRQPQIKLTLTKNIPAGSGLGSASSDAAATLSGLNRFLNLDVPAVNLSEMAAELGSDIAFFLGGPLALCTGKGEKVKIFEKKFNFLAILIIPDISVPTKRVYANYKHDQALYNSLKKRIIDCIAKNDIDLLPRMCANMLASSCFNLNKKLADLKEEVESLDIRPLCLSGSGSAMFCSLSDKDGKEAQRWRKMIEEKVGCKSVIVSNNRW
jgi:4-diphosphocytidyl-2-C-methyl-D-erythritol kinase